MIVDVGMSKSKNYANKVEMGNTRRSNINKIKQTTSI